ncbi:MAG: hypothetical protein KF685_03220 [Acidobacteria bacterium]|nr:hypothetical protein [Acidobacteriota bacterium]
MSSTFTLYVKQKGGSLDSAQKAVTLLKTYLPSIIAKASSFSSADAVLVDENASPTLLETDVIVYIVRNTAKSIIVKKGGSIAMAESNGNILGLTDLNLKICEVYYDRIYDGSAKELSGACYHEAAHILSNLDNSLHKGQNGFLKDAPDYYGTPTEENTDFMAKHLGRKIKMDSSL